MKIKTTALDFERVKSLPKYRHKKPCKPSIFFRTILKIAGSKDLKDTNFSAEFKGISKDEIITPALFLMNHSSFIDLEIATTLLYPQPLNIVCTSDGFVGKEWLMRHLGCIPTRKFITDATLVRDMLYCTKTLRSSILMYPEASYTFDGTATTLPEGLAKCVKLLKVPVYMIKTEGAFLRDPLYNMLQKRKTKVTATVECIFTGEQIKNISVAEIGDILTEHFTFDNFKTQQEKGIKITEPFRADGLNRVLYKCPHCLCEGETEGKGTNITCKKCKKEWELTESGFLKATDSEDYFTHIPDWYAWERKCVKEEILNGSYRLDIPVDIRVMVDMKSIYEIGSGRLVHTKEGFTLTSDDKKLCYFQKPQNSYSLYSDYYWYELGDMICIGDTDMLYYCFPKANGDVVAKTRLATEELYKICKIKDNISEI